jgi:hypothetical protein
MNDSQANPMIKGIVKHQYALHETYKSVMLTGSISLYGATRSFLGDNHHEYAQPPCQRTNTPYRL